MCVSLFYGEQSTLVQQGPGARDEHSRFSTPYTRDSVFATVTLNKFEFVFFGVSKNSQLPFGL